MLISDWSSDVCSSDLCSRSSSADGRKSRRSPPPRPARTSAFSHGRLPSRRMPPPPHSSPKQAMNGDAETDRKSVGSGKSVSVSVDLGGGRIIKTHKLDIENTKKDITSTTNN